MACKFCNCNNITNYWRTYFTFATVTHILQRKKLMYMELKYFFQGQYMPGSWLGPKPPASESTHLATLCTASRVTLVVNNSPGTAGDISDVDSIPRLGRSPGRGHGNSLQDSCLENPHEQKNLAGYSQRVAKSRTRFKRLSVQAHIILGFQES